MDALILVGWAVLEALGVWEEEVPEGTEARVGKYASTGIKSMSTSGDASTRAALLLPASFRVYSALIHQISVEEKRVTSMPLIASRGTPVHRHSSVISTGNREVWLCLALWASPAP
ncbi:hypothetical protein H5410_030372 [Solanum commersonii]|uniref:Secreted protein n=1 Tax=Solanum commersonii TaxID=4109 RepID=A0A9J5YFH8_SOLCO|nr:hypothetical protein H5410_030372 [Solanum commersonii]